MLSVVVREGKLSYSAGAGWSSHRSREFVMMHALRFQCRCVAVAAFCVYPGPRGGWWYSRLAAAGDIGRQWLTSSEGRCHVHVACGPGHPELSYMDMASKIFACACASSFHEERSSATLQYVQNYTV